MKKNTTGFTIVELLIVIVVIAILAAISIVAYTGIQNRAYDSAVQQDLRSLANTIRLYEAEHGQLPAFGTEASVGNNLAFPGITFPASKSAYYEGQNNLFVCKSQTTNTTDFGIAARSKSGKVFAWTTQGGFVNYTASWPTSTTICPHLGFDPFYFSYGKTSSTWAGWVN